MSGKHEAREYTGHEMALSEKVVVDVCDREDARIFDNGRLAVWLWILPPGAGNQQLIRATARIRARFRRRQADGTGNREVVQPR
jgi:hypothetical protein